MLPSLNCEDNWPFWNFFWRYPTLPANALIRCTRQLDFGQMSFSDLSRNSPPCCVQMAVISHVLDTGLKAASVCSLSVGWNFSEMLKPYLKYLTATGIYFVSKYSKFRIEYLQCI